MPTDQDHTAQDSAPKTALPCRWPPPPAKLKLSVQEIHVWCAGLNLSTGHLAQLWPLLSADEQERANRFVFDKHKAHFIAGRAILRLILSRYLSFPPELLQFDYNPQGKPALVSPADGSPLQFNLAHSNGLGLYALSIGQPLGIDVEAIRPIESMSQIARRFFSEGEYAALETVAASQQATAFFNCWTRKEAFVKATGEGLSRPLDQFEVTLKPDEPAKLLHIAGQPAGSWTLVALRPAAGYAGALAIQGDSWRFSYWRWTAAELSQGRRSTAPVARS